MSISGVSSVGVVYPVQDSSQTGNSQDNFSAFEQLAAALQAGNLAAAQQAYNSLASLTQNSPSGQSSSQVSADFNALGQALQSGDLSAAQQAFSTFQQAALQGLGIHGHHHHHGGGGGGQVQSSTDNAPDSLFNSSSSNSNSSNSNGNSDSAANSQTNNSINLLNLFT